ncbi:MAG TPA: exodeoxyribonuclease III [Catalimonadaceae bacterium]|nr:exodeoxyribonuclease III [Catalimonadaceae bacterium]
MKILTYNVNGIRAAVKKGLVEFLAQNQADIVCFQETKAQASDVDFAPFEALGYSGHWFSADKKGYSGTAIFTKLKPENVVIGCGHPQFDLEGRHLLLDFGIFAVQSLYAPSGTSGDIRQTVKYEWMDFFFTYAQELKKKYPKILFCGDYNIANHPIDIHNPKSNAKTSGFLPEEREWMSKLISEADFIDTFRHFFPDTPHQYTWWSQRFPSVRAKNLGWRIDYILASPELRPHLESVKILPDAAHSDHCPMEIVLRGL